VFGGKWIGATVLYLVIDGSTVVVVVDGWAPCVVTLPRLAAAILKSEIIERDGGFAIDFLKPNKIRFFLSTVHIQ